VEDIREDEQPEEHSNEEEPFVTPQMRRIAKMLVPVIAVVILGGAAYCAYKWPPAYMAVYSATLGPEQPIPFSHKVHAKNKRISCLFCHHTADQGPKAGLPTVDKCLLCHNEIISQFPPIQDIHESYDEGEGIPWVRVYRVADHAHFNHQVHVLKGFDCAECHGNVREMDRILLNQKIHMGWCVDCHRENDATVDCLACHR
jgi:hypothetical protein